MSSSLPFSWFKLTTKIKHHSKSEIGVGFELGMYYHSSWSYTIFPLPNFISFWDSTSSTGCLGYPKAFWSFCWLSLDRTHQPEASQAWTARTFQVESPFPPCFFSTIWDLLDSFLNPVCVRISIAVRKWHDQKVLWEERLCFSTQLSGHGLSVNEVRSGTWLDVRTYTKSMEEHCPLAWFHSLHSLLFYICQDYLPRNDTTHGGQGRSTPIINQEKAQQSCLKANLMETFSQLWFLFLRWL